ncbi:hypothetical protein [Streptomyces sp. TLI_146]|uniref:hypothetical protein n=1 Tax=Streptomyces sp. TLI_146 TaxID=1938858 RepID=UPI000C7101A9|nr:hypothetical protein [Streptomyces sp. TLI_146]PKV82827.1 hypothetical protein BX283_0290 [Streptomyces sp. TLI_146]
MAGVPGFPAVAVGGPGNDTIAIEGLGDLSNDLGCFVARVQGADGQDAITSQGAVSAFCTYRGGEGNDTITDTCTVGDGGLEPVSLIGRSTDRRPL